MNRCVCMQGVGHRPPPSIAPRTAVRKGLQVAQFSVACTLSMGLVHVRGPTVDLGPASMNETVFGGPPGRSRGFYCSTVCGPSAGRPNRHDAPQLCLTNV